MAGILRRFFASRAADSVEESADDGPLDADAAPTDLPDSARRELARLEQLRGDGIKRYEWVCFADGCDACRARAEGGPYDVDYALAGVDPVPGRDTHADCRCSIAAPEEARSKYHR